MTKAKTTPLETRYQQLPKYACVPFKETIKPMLDKAGISESTFKRDLIADPDSIPTGRLKFYAQLFSCSIDDLLNNYTKVSPIIKQKSISKRLGIKTN